MIDYPSGIEYFKKEIIATWSDCITNGGIEDMRGIKSAPGKFSPRRLGDADEMFILT